GRDASAGEHAGGESTADGPAPSDAPTGDDASNDEPTTHDPPSPDDSTTDDHPSPDDSTTEAAPIFELPDHRADGEADRSSGNGEAARRPGRTDERTLVLGGAAAAEGRTTGPNPRIGGPLPAEARHPPDGTGRAGVEQEEPPGRHFRASTGDRDGGPPRWALALAAVPVFALVLLV